MVKAINYPIYFKLGKWSVLTTDKEIYSFYDGKKTNNISRGSNYKESMKKLWETQKLSKNKSLSQTKIKKNTNKFTEKYERAIKTSSKGDFDNNKELEKEVMGKIQVNKGIAIDDFSKDETDSKKTIEKTGETKNENHIATEPGQYISIEEIKKYGNFFALKTPEKVIKQGYNYDQYKLDPEKFLKKYPFWKKIKKTPKLAESLKAPEITRTKNPTNYMGVDDEKWGSGLNCERIEELKSYFTVIDLDYGGEIPLEKIEKAFSFIMNETHVRKTPSGGYHIYLLSKEKPSLPQPSKKVIKIDYQKTGRYVVFDYRYEVFAVNEEGILEQIDLIKLVKKNFHELRGSDINESEIKFFKSYGLKMGRADYVPANDKGILIVESSDEILEKGLNNLGIKATKQLAIDSDIHNIDFEGDDYTFDGKILVESLSPFFTKTHYHKLGLYLTGFLYRNLYSEGFTENILNSFNKDGEGDVAIQDILNSVYRHDIGVEVPGWNSLSNYIKEYDLEENKINFALYVLYTGFKRDISHPSNNAKFKDEENYDDIDKVINILKTCFSPKTSHLESEKLLYYLYKKGIIYSQIKFIFKELFGNKYWERLKNAKKVFNERKSKLQANTLLAYIVGEKIIKKIKKKHLVESMKHLDIRKDMDYYFRLIQDLNDKDEKIPHVILYNYIEKKYQLRGNDTGTTIYRPTNKGYKEITSIEFSKSLVNEFGNIPIPRDTIEKTFQNVNQILAVKHNILHFKNGSLEIPKKGLKPIFKENEFLKNALPKITFPFNWNPKAEGGKIKEIVEKALDDENLKIFLKSLGHSCMAKIENHIIIILVGPPGTSKSTLLMMLKRALSYSEITVSEIVKNERFVLFPVVNKDINIDDDLQNNMLKGIGNLNRFIAGGGGVIETKNSNIRIELNNKNTPKIWAASNNLPPVIGDGFERRLILIKVPHKIKPDEVDIHLQNDILEGKYDEDLEWLYYTAITKYLKERNKPFVSQEQKKAMFKEFKNKSDSLFNCVEELFEFAKGEYVENGEAKEMIMEWHEKREKDGTIFKEQKGSISSQKIRKALERLGADKTRKLLYVSEFETEQKTVYMDIKKK